MENPKPTLTVKSPSDRVPSHVITYDPSWSVKDLKQHLCDTYPTHPSPSAQRLIHAGKLLTDETSLSILFKNCVSSPTVHLVCRNMETTASSSKPSASGSTCTTDGTDPISSIPPEEMQQYQRQYFEYLKNFYAACSNPPICTGDGNSSNGHSAQTTAWPFVYSWGAQGMPAPNYFPYSMYPMYAPPAATISGQPEASSAEIPAAEPVLPGVMNRVEVGNDVQPVQNPQPQPQQQQQGMLVGNPMAGGLLGGEELGENGGNLDIVDRFYMIFRFALFLGLCFAYSSLDKAIIVLSVAAYVYLYNIYRRHAAHRRVAPAAIPAPANHPVNPDPPASGPSASHIESNDRDEDRDSSETHLRHRSTTANPESEIFQPAADPESRLTRLASSVRLVLTVSFQFVSSLITSLVPEQPPPIRLD